MPRLQTLLRTLLLSLALVMAASAPASAASPLQGDVRYVQEADSSFDRHTENPSPEAAAWMRDKYYRQKTYAPYFDERLSWYPNGWTYKDLYALYVDDDVARRHPDWVLRDQSGRKLYIPFGCENGTCPQYAGDVGNPEFRAYWIREAQKTVAQGYKGLFVDDVNMEFRVGNGQGEQVAPVDPRTGRTMSHTAWKRYTAEFVERIRSSLPGVEIAHNPIWFSGHDDPSVRRALLAADYIDLERGVSDDGITRGGGQFGYETFLNHVDWLHARGKAVVFDSYAANRTDVEYNLASYFLVNGTRDGFRTNWRDTPGDWWGGYDVKLGAARGDRYEWNGMLRRDFERGYVVVNQPDSPARTVASGVGARGPDGALRPVVRLAGGEGAVVLADSGAAGALSRGARSGGAKAAHVSLRAIANPRRALTSGASRARNARLRGTLLVGGGVRRASRVKLTLHRRVGGRLVRLRSQVVRVGPDGRFTRLFQGMRRGSVTVTARAVAAGRRTPTAKRTVRLAR